MNLWQAGSVQDPRVLTAPTGAAPLPYGSSEEAEARWKQRTKQVSIGKSTAGYDNYLRCVPKAERVPGLHLGTPPVTPRSIENKSKRDFEKDLRQWRKFLHSYDDVEDGECPWLARHRAHTAAGSCVAVLVPCGPLGDPCIGGHCLQPEGLHGTAAAARHAEFDCDGVDIAGPFYPVSTWGDKMRAAPGDDFATPCTQGAQPAIIFSKLRGDAEPWAPPGVKPTTPTPPQHRPAECRGVVSTKDSLPSSSDEGTVATPPASTCSTRAVATAPASVGNRGARPGGDSDSGSDGGGTREAPKCGRAAALEELPREIADWEPPWDDDANPNQERVWQVLLGLADDGPPALASDDDDDDASEPSAPGAWPSDVLRAYPSLSVALAVLESGSGTDLAKTALKWLRRQRVALQLV